MICCFLVATRAEEGGPCTKPRATEFAFCIFRLSSLSPSFRSKKKKKKKLDLIVPPLSKTKKKKTVFYNSSLPPPTMARFLNNHSLLAGVPLLAFLALLGLLLLASSARAANIHLQTDSEGWHRGRATYFGASPELVETFERVRGAGSYGDLHYGSCGMYRKPQVRSAFWVVEKKKGNQREEREKNERRGKKTKKISPFKKKKKKKSNKQTNRASKPSAPRTSPSTRPTPPRPPTPTLTSPGPAADATRSAASPASSRRTTTTTRAA